MTVDVYDLVKRYGDHFKLFVPSWRVEAGETLGLVGNNGAGKTTFLRLLLDLIEPDDGHASIGGQSVAFETGWKIDVGAYLDESFLLDFLTPEEFLSFTGRIYQMSKREIDAAIARYDGFLPMEAFSRTPPYIRDLSMGNKKKIGLVAALMSEPRLLILDEPFANLDPGSQIRLKNLLRRLRSEAGTTMIISSHDLVHVTEVCARIALLGQGRIVRDTPTSEATLTELELYFATAS